tara:strand:- start:72682 stop:73653 length:972 start_codon:yes stop_codon:yes gene_type:complete
MKKVLIIGGGGYVGTPLCQHLADQEYEVTSLDTFWFGNHHGPRIKSIHYDICDSISNKLPINLDEYETVIFLAAISNDPSAELSHEITKNINDIATKRMIDLIDQSQVKRLIYASSSSIYGIKEEEKVTEELPAAPLTLYSQLKYDIEKYLQKIKNTDYVIIRPATVFGPSPRLRLDVVVNILTAHALYNRKIKVFGGSQYRPNIYIDDIVNFYGQLVEWKNELKGEIFNFGGPNYQVKELAHFVQEKCPFETIIETIPSDDDRSYRVSSEKALNYFSIDKLTDMQEGIGNLFQYLQKEVSDWKNPQYSNMSHLKKILQTPRK